MKFMTENVCIVEHINKNEMENVGQKTIYFTPSNTILHYSEILQIDSNGLSEIEMFSHTT